jgi:primary-amine oxidase
VTGPHPLDPLTADEIRRVTALLRRERGVARPQWRIAAIELREPAKEVVRAHRAGDPVERVARAIVWDTSDGLAYVAVLALPNPSGPESSGTESSGPELSGSDDTLLAWEPQPGRQPNATVDEWHECDEAMRRHPDVIAALAERGIDDPSLTLIDVWTYGATLIPEPFAGRRIGWCDVWLRGAPGGNPYAHPVSGLKLVVDMNTMDLLEIQDGPDPGLPEVMGEYTPAHVPGYAARTTLRPLQVVQPEGASFTLDGHALSWENWRMRLGFTYREGLVLHEVGWAEESGAEESGADGSGADGSGADGSGVRPIAHRLSFAEMVVPYRDPTPDHLNRTAFDVGEWGLGFMTTSLDLGCDCLGEITYVDAVLHDSAGEPTVIRNAICLHEEDDGVAWKHVDGLVGAEVRRRRRMVVSFHATVANYEYLVYWRFYEDGTIECEVRATGIMVTTPFPEGAEPPPYGTVVDTRTYAPIHQHFLVARLDLDVDGEPNTVVMTETMQLPVGPDNPYGLGLAQAGVPLTTEGGFDPNWATQRAWKVQSSTRRNAHGTPTAYKLAPSGAFPAMIDPSSPVFERAQVIGHTLWVTPFHADERWPCGEFVNQSVADEGLAIWTRAQRPIDDTDVVLWYVFGIHHVPRVEDWPVMPVDIVSFRLAPAGFFDRNPALDVAPQPGHGGAHCTTDGASA